MKKMYLVHSLIIKLNINAGLRIPCFYLALLSFASIGCENDIEKVKLVTGKDRIPVEHATGLNIVYSDSSVMKVRVVAKLMNRYQGDDPYTEMPEGIKVEFFNNDLKPSTTMTAKRAIKREKAQQMEAFGNVEVVNAKGEKLNTEHLVWNEITKKISSDEFVKITTSDKIIYGKGFESNQDFTSYRIFKITGTINISRNENTPNP
ncbi:MAG: LPS export ABC transporter periplasmic protein LptC [Bacteroidota bacterium]